MGQVVEIEIGSVVEAEPHGALEPSFSDDDWVLSKHGDPLELNEKALAHFEKLMGCKVRQMWRIGY